MYIYIYIYIHIIYGKEIKLSFQVLRVSCKHSFTFFSLIITDVTYCIQTQTDLNFPQKSNPPPYYFLRNMLFPSLLIQENKM